MERDPMKLGIVGVGRGRPSSYHAISFSSIINNFEEAYSLMELAEKNVTLVISTSALRYAKETEEAKNEPTKAGKIDCDIL